MLAFRRFFFFLLISSFSFILAQSSDFCEKKEPNLLDDLLIVQYWNERLNDHFPVTYDHLLQGGYFSMPSARMGKEGEVAVGYGYVHPYIHYNLRMQIVDFLEITGSYRIFKGVDDPVLTPMGFGDYSDKGANVKLSLFSPESSHYRLPGLAIGVEDFLGTKSFNAYYLVFTQVYLKQNLEISLGYGSERIRGFFGGMSWMPFRRTKWDYLRNLSLVAEYDAIPYSDETLEKHPKGRKKYTPIQIGLKYRLWDSIDLSAAYIRGYKFAFTVSTFYNFGTCKGFIPKIDNALPYKAPINLEPIGCLRSEETMVQDFIYAMRTQGFEVHKAWLMNQKGRQVFRLQVTNYLYRELKDVRERLNAILCNLTPENIDEIVIVLDNGLTSLQELHYETAYLQLFREQKIGKYELETLTRMTEVFAPTVYSSKLLFEKPLDRWNLEVLPKTNTIFGSSKGKFKYALGLTANLNGFLFDQVYYSISVGYFFATDIHHINSVDRLNPSQLINVRTSVVNYFKYGIPTLDEAYLEKITNWGKGFFTRVSAGYFELEYGGFAGEALYYPVNSNWAVGIEGAVVKRRSEHGLGFTGRIRKLHGFEPHYVKFLGSQYFLNVYYDWKETNLEFKVSAGKFLANDVGGKIEVSRYFPSGLRIGCWYTYTNGHDIVNNEVYHDKGVFFSVPLDIFYTRASRTRWGYGMSAWLRDVGATAFTGGRLYDLINQERQ